MNLSQLIDYLGSKPEFHKNVTVWKKIPAHESLFADFPDSLPERISDILKRQGISKLYSHQTTAYDKIRKGKNVVVVTPTASGKTLTYNLPILHSLL
jgi:DEAD/DEAH box helicase domain-containing protein